MDTDKKLVLGGRILDGFWMVFLFGAILYWFCTGFWTGRKKRETTDYTDEHGWEFLKNKNGDFYYVTKLSPYIFLKI